ncbi:csl zinc finger domain [Cyclospora cayetanensis]|uniref:Csl zinc finger domain n=1 Tax=Cyclospora cayetanensis TaxID=88456 RepID=A0A1D3DAU7_9EIME|nr:csl zinc finger domain [Cyclospora cayetanensis]
MLRRTAPAATDLAVAATVVASGDRSTINRETVLTLNSTRVPCFLSLQPPLRLRGVTAGAFQGESEAKADRSRALPASDAACELKAAIDPVEVVLPSTQASGGQSTSIRSTTFSKTSATVFEGGTAVEEEAIIAYEEVNLQDLEFDALDQQFLYPCPCGDLFELTVADLQAAVAAAASPSPAFSGFAIASCPSCSLQVKVLFEIEQLRHLEQHLGLTLLPDGEALKRHRTEPPPPFLCVLRPSKRREFAQGGGPSSTLSGDTSDPLSRALVFNVEKEKEGGSVTRGGGAQAQLLSSPDVSREEASSSAREVGIEESATFWSAFNTPLRAEVFGLAKDTSAAGKAERRGVAALEGAYHNAIEEAVRSLRRFRVDGSQHQAGEDLSSSWNTQQHSSLLLRDGVATANVIDVCCTDGPRGAADSAGAGADAEEYDYDLYAIECDGEGYEDIRRKGTQDCCGSLLESHRRRLLELLQQDSSAVALVEVEDVDPETGTVVQRSGGMQLFLEEYGDIDDSASDEGGEIDYPSSESSGDSSGRGRSSRRGTSNFMREGSKSYPAWDYDEDLGCYDDEDRSSASDGSDYYDEDEY